MTAVVSLPPQGRHIVVVIPAVNEEDAIGRVLADVPHDLVEMVVVVDNGSTDDTVARAESAGAVVLHESRRGYGFACLRGIDHARQTGARILVFLDGDYADHPDEMGRVLEPILDDRADLVIGSRLAGSMEPGAMPAHARLGNRVACLLMRWIWGTPFTDLGPFRAIRMDAFDRLGLNAGTFGWTVEMQIRAAEAGLRLSDVPVSYRPRIGQSKVSGTVKGSILASIGILRTIGGMAFTRRVRTYD